MPPPDNDECMRICHDVGRFCHPLGLHDTTRNVHKYYTNIDNIPDEFFVDAASLRRLQDNIQRCYRARNDC